MTLKQLEAFYWAATCTSFAMAARKVHLSVSSLSKRIAELEASLGQELFDRSRNRAVLTDAGTVLVPRARELLTAAEKLRSDMRQALDLEGTCRIGVGELTALTWLPHLVRSIKTHHPRLTVELFIGIGQLLEQRLVEGELDFAVVAGRSSNSAISSRWIGEAGFTWYAATEAAPDVQDVDQRLFETMPLVCLPAGSGATRLLHDWLRERGVVPGERIVCNHWEAVAGLIREGLGFGLLPRGWADGFVGSQRLRRLRSEPELSSLAYFFHWRSDDYRAILDAMRELVQAEVRFERPPTDERVAKR